MCIRDRSVRRGLVQDSPCTVAIELVGKCPYGGVQGTDTQGLSDSLIRCQVMGFTRPVQSSVQERPKLWLMGLSQVVPYRARVGR